MATPSQQVSKDALRRLEEFSDEFASALAMAPALPWAEQFGLVRRTDALKTTFPIPIDAAGYKELMGDIKFRNLYHRSLSMVSKEWYDGVEAKAKVVEAPDFGDWAGAPKRMADEWARHPNLLVASMLATSTFAGPLLDFYRDSDSDTPSARRLFATDHPCNVLDSGAGTFDNIMTTTVADITSGKCFDDLEDRFALVDGPNGQPMGLGLANILVPQGRKTLFRNVLEFDTLVRAVDAAGKVNQTSGNVAAVTQNNVYKGTIGWTVGKELTSADYFYAFADKPDLVAWILQIGTAPEEILHDKSSELYKRQRKIGVAYVGQANSAACLPHGIIRVQITG
jgi:hypothetical protein